MLLFSIPDPIFSHPNVKEKIAVWLRETSRESEQNNSSISPQTEGWKSIESAWLSIIG